MGYWACMFCGNPREESGMGSLCCGEVNHTEWIEDDDEDQPSPESFADAPARLVGFPQTHTVLR